MFTRWVIISLSMLQIIKLYAFQSVFVTQVCASMFFGPFLVIELLVVLLKGYTSLGAPDAKEVVKGSGATSLPYLTVTMSTCFVLYVGIQASASMFKSYGLPLDALQCTGLIILFCGSAAFVISGLYAHLLRIRERIPNRTVNEVTLIVPRIRILALENIPLLFILAIPTVYYLLSYLLSPLRRDQHPLDPTTGNIVAPIMIVIWASLCLYGPRSRLKP